MTAKRRQFISPFQYNPGKDPTVVTYLQGLKGGDAPGTFLLVGANNSPGPTPLGLVYQGPLDAVEKKTGKVFVIEAKGETIIERSLYFIHIVDWASFYLCDLNKADIMDIEIIDYLKSELANF